MLSTQVISERDCWNIMLRNLPYNHILQTWEWGEFKRETVGWKPERIAYYVNGRIVGAASVLTRRVGGFNVMYVPKGPAMDYDDTALTTAILDHLVKLAKQRRALWLKIDPDVIATHGTPEEGETSGATGTAVMATLAERGWQRSADQVQFRNTITIDLQRDEDDILMAMSQNTRRKVRTASKKGVTVREGTLEDLTTLYDLYRITGERDEFLIRPPEYYERAWHDFMRAGLAHALIAEVEGRPIAHVILFHFGRACWYFYGASSNEERERMPNYLLQWEAMRWAKAHGYALYDMWGAPDVFDESDPMWGVYGFKRGFRGDVAQHIGAWDYAPNPLLYRAYVELWPRLRNLLRRVK